MKKLLKEFKEFIAKGNVLDLAVAVVIGNAFSKIVSSIVSDLIMPIVGIIIGGHDFTGLKLTIGTSNITYGNLIQNIVDFLIISACIFIVVKIMSKIMPKKQEDKMENIKEKKEKMKKIKSYKVKILKEIRDELKKVNK